LLHPLKGIANNDNIANLKIEEFILFFI
jgi:hypothetical protein